MPAHDSDTRIITHPDQDSLELNKETLGDLDVEPTDAGQIRGGGFTATSTGVTATTNLTITTVSTQKTKD